MAPKIQTLQSFDEAAFKLATEIADQTGETIEMAVRMALKERAESIRAEASRMRLVAELDRIAERCASLPILDRRGADAIIGYDENGVPQ